MTPADRGGAGRVCTPPRLFRAIASRLFPEPDRSFVLEDLAEEHSDIASRDGSRAANSWYRGQVLRSVPPAVALRLARPGRRGSHVSELPMATTRRTRRMPAFTRLFQDLRQAWRSVVRNPKYATIVILTFALASGANIAVFSVVDSVLLRPLPYHQPDRLAMTYRVTDHGDESRFSLLDFRDVAVATSSFESWAAFTTTARTWLGESGGERWVGTESTPELFEVLGVPALHGRTLTPDADRIGDPVIVLGHGLWERRFEGDPGIIGRAIPFDGQTLTVVGVMPPGFYFPTQDQEYWVPLGQRSGSAGEFPLSLLENRSAWTLLTIGRLAEGVSLESAEAEVLAVTRRVDAAHADGQEGETLVRVSPRHEEYVGDTKRLFAILLGAVGLVLAVACANIANIALTRAAVRERELAVRSALGAGRRRLARQLVAEHVMLALLGAAVGLAVAFAVVRGLVALGPDDIPRLGEVGVHLAAFGYAIVIAAVCGIMFGAAPAFAASRHEISDALEDARGASLGRGTRRLLEGLVTSQIALAVVLVVGASLLANSFLRLSSVRPGFDTERVLIVDIDLAADRYADPESIEAFYADVERRLLARPAIEGFGFSTHLPFSGSGLSASFEYVRADGERVEGTDMEIEVVSPGYFDAIGVPLQAGRDLTPEDQAGAPLVAVINRTMADRLWPDGDAIGRRFTLDPDRDDAWHTVAGIVAPTLKAGLDDVERPIAYFPRRQFASTYRFISGRSGYLAVRTSVDPGSLAAVVRNEIAEVDPALPLSTIRTSRELVARSVAAPRFRALVVSCFAGVALLVALVGVYGVMAFVVARRTREIGIRMSLGATDGLILTSVLRRGLMVVSVGLVLGLAGAFALSRIVAAMLYGMSPNDPTSYLAAGALVTVAGLLASWVPAHRATRVDPVQALRAE